MSICVFILADDGRFYLKYSHGQYRDLCGKYGLPDNKSMVFKVAQTNQAKVFEDIKSSRKQTKSSY